MTLLVLYHSSRFKTFKTFYEGVILTLLRPAFPKAPCYARFIALTSHVWVPLTVFLLSRMGRKSGLYYIDSTALAVCHNRRIGRHKVFAGLAARGKTSTGEAGQRFQRRSRWNGQMRVVLRLQTSSGVQP